MDGTHGYGSRTAHLRSTTRNRPMGAGSGAMGGPSGQHRPSDRQAASLFILQETHLTSPWLVRPISPWGPARPVTGRGGGTRANHPPARSRLGLSPRGAGEREHARFPYRRIISGLGIIARFAQMDADRFAWDLFPSKLCAATCSARAGAANLERSVNGRPPAEGTRGQGYGPGSLSGRGRRKGGVRLQQRQRVA